MVTKLLIKFPTRNRPVKFFNVLDQYIKMANNINQIAFLISLDHDDNTMHNQYVVDKLEEYKKNINLHYYFGNSKTKIEAVNVDVDKVSGWEILLLASDDMVPVIKGYDDVIREDMTNNFTDTDGTLWYNDGHQDRINTLCILGKKYYERFNYIYHPDYVSLCCDNEFTDVSLSLNLVYKSNKIIIEHQHPTWQKAEFDMLYARNEGYKHIDTQTYNRRKNLNFK